VDVWVDSGCTMLELNDATKDVDGNFANPSQELALHAEDERTVILSLVVRTMMFS
jgi:hypothetical protein